MNNSVGRLGIELLEEAGFCGAFTSSFSSDSVALWSSSVTSRGLKREKSSGDEARTALTFSGVAVYW